MMRTLPIFLGGILLLRIGLARAAAPEAEGAAEALFQQAREDMRRGAYSDACPKLAESERLDPSSGTLLNLVLCEEKLGKVASAWLHALELDARLKQSDARKPIAERKVAELAARAPKLTLRLAATAPPDTKVVLDDVELGASSFGVPIPIDPGTHRIVIRASTRIDRVSEISIKETQAYDFVAEAGAEQAAASAESAARRRAAPSTLGTREAETASGATDKRDRARAPSRTESSGPPKWVGWVAGGVGLAALAASAVMGEMALERKAEVEDNCPNKLCRDQSGLDAAAQGKRLVVGSFAALAIGAAGVGVGVYVLGRSAAGERTGSRSPFFAAPSTTMLFYVRDF